MPHRRWLAFRPWLVWQRQAPAKRSDYRLHAWVHDAGSPCLAMWADGLPRPVGAVHAYGNAIDPGKLGSSAAW
ncbi:MAG: hypothetical protein ACO25D_12830, partial [Burkholderiaceae bacterium]